MREIRQKEFTEYLCGNELCILNVAPRTGKCLITINYLKVKNYSNILIVHPLTSIKKSWLDEFKKWDFDKSKVHFSTTASLKNLIGNDYEVVIADEIHQYSSHQLQSLKFVLSKMSNKKCIGLTGTITNATAQEIKELTGLTIGVKYSIEQAISEGIIADYKIVVIQTDLDNKKKYITPNKFKPTFQITEQQHYDYLTNQIDDIKASYGNLGLLPIFRQGIFKQSIAKAELTKKLIEKYQDERILVFCGVTKIADRLGIPVYHSKSNEVTIKDDFCSGKFNHLAVCKLLNAGITVLPITRAIINSFDSNAETLAQQINRLTNFEYDNPDKIAQVMIVSTITKAEMKWLEKALSFFNPEKITYKKFDEL